MEEQNSRLDCRMHGSPTGRKSESLPFYISCTEVNSFLCINYFLNKYEEFGGFILILAYILIHNEFFYTISDIDNLYIIIKNKRVHHLETEPSHANKGRGLGLLY